MTTQQVYGSIPTATVSPEDQQPEVESSPTGSQQKENPLDVLADAVKNKSGYAARTNAGPGVEKSATPYGPDIPIMTPPMSETLPDSGVRPEILSSNRSHVDNRAPQLMTLSEPVSELKIVSDQIIGDKRIITVSGPNIEVVTGMDARRLAWNQRVVGGWINAGIEQLSVYPVNDKGELITDRAYGDNIHYHSEWGLTIMG